MFECYINGIIESVFFDVWLSALKIMFSGLCMLSHRVQFIPVWMCGFVDFCLLVAVLFHSMDTPPLDGHRVLAKPLRDTASPPGAQECRLHEPS